MVKLPRVCQMIFLARRVYRDLEVAAVLRFHTGILFKLITTHDAL